MKFIIFGYGSIGQRHARNLHALRPDSWLSIFDPFLAGGAHLPVPSIDENRLNDIAADAAIIASPSIDHYMAMQWCRVRAIPFMVEKPPVIPAQLPGYRDLVVALNYLPCAVGFQYRFHAATTAIKSLAAMGQLTFYARDNLLGKYGPDVAGVMATHPIDTALRFLGPAVWVNLESDGKRLAGSVGHQLGLSLYDLDISIGPRVSRVCGGDKQIELPPDDNAYLLEMAAWLRGVEGGECEPRLATLADGLRVMEVLAEVRHV